MSRLIPFDTVWLSPANIYKMEIAGDTVTVHTNMMGIANMPFTEDFIFGSGALAQTALDDFVAAANAPWMVTITNDPLQTELVGTVTVPVDIVAAVTLAFSEVDDDFSFAEAVEVVTGGFLSNNDIVKNSLNNLSIGDIDARLDALSDAIIESATRLKAKYDAVP